VSDDHRHASSSGPRAGVTVRAAAAGDIPAIAETLRQGFATYATFMPAGWEPPADVTDHGVIGSLLALPRACAFVAEAGGEPAGHVVLVPASESRLRSADPALAHVVLVFVRELFWGTGVARALHAQMLDAARDEGFTSGVLFVIAAQHRARGFYEREGWWAAGPAAYEPALATDVVEYRRTF
jgi:GNAT superfamily N-acetyltransferase